MESFTEGIHLINSWLYIIIYDPAIVRHTIIVRAANTSYCKTFAHNTASLKSNDLFSLKLMDLDCLKNRYRIQWKWD
jgi:hypothetical protein